MALLTSAEHPRADAVYENVRTEHPHISLATVHRTLETLCEIGEARKVTTLHDSARYDGNLAPHHHVVCIKCRRVRDIEIPELEQALKGRAAIGDFQVLGSSLEIQALCADCREGGPTRAKHGQGIQTTEPIVNITNRQPLNYLRSHRRGGNNG